MVERENGGDKRGEEADVIAVARAMAYDRYVQALLVPSRLRDDFLLLAAYYGELARIPFMVHEPMMGEIRLQWWLDVIDRSAQGQPAGSPLADRVGAFLRRNQWACEPFVEVIEARRLELLAGSMTGAEAFDTFSSGIGAAPFGVAARLLGGPVEGSVWQSLQSAGRAIALCEAALRLPTHLALMRLPSVFTEFVDSDPLQVPDSERQAVVRTANQRILVEALKSLTEYRGQLPNWSEVNLAVLPLALVEPYLRALQKPRLRPRRTTEPLAPITRFLRLWWAGTRGRI